MKTKYSIIPFIPAVIAALGLKLMSIFGTDGSGLLFGMNKSTVNYVVIGIALVLFAVCVVINLTDRKTAPVYAVKKNPFAGFTALLSGFAAAGSSIMALFNITTDSSDTYLMCIITAVFSIPAAVAMILIGKIHFTGKSSVSNTSMFYVLPALWSCTELVSEFLQATKVSISASDMTPLFCYIFITLYLFSSSMIVSRVKGKNPVKACFIYGFPAATVCLAGGVGTVATATIESTGIQTLVSGAMFVVFALYILSFTLEIFGGCMTKAEIEIVDSLPKDDDTYENSYISSGAYDELIASDSEIPESRSEQEEQEEQPRPKTYAEVAAEDMNDFIMGYDPDAEYASRENSTDAGAYDFSHDLILGTEGVTEGEFIREMNPEPETPVNAEQPEPRTVMGGAAAVSVVKEPAEDKADKKAKLNKRAAKKAAKAEKAAESIKAEVTAVEAPKTEAAEHESRAAVQSREQASVSREVQKPRRSTAQPSRNAQPNGNAQQQKPRRRPRPAAENQGVQTAHTGSRPVSSASRETPVRRTRPASQARPSRPAQPARQAQSAHQAQSVRPAADNSVSSTRMGSSYGSYGDYSGYDNIHSSRSAASAADAYSHDDTTVSSERMSDIDRLLKELEDKK